MISCFLEIILKIGTFCPFFIQKMRNVKKSGTFRSFLVLFRHEKIWDVLGL